MISNMRIVGGQTQQVVHEAEDDQKTGDGGQNEHHLGLLNAVLAERLGGESTAYLHVMLLMVGGEHESWARDNEYR